ncbi:hypothetical protein E2C01_065553 [Portunus trituberculatus]|uniref:Uncharacterized protein n=1 Tax=Portunus trituberculatus TaxID=210409 RepID=A0A5B7HEW8_PORTR|nr:hypothetical protein [Portunus trituberculatus]
MKSSHRKLEIQKQREVPEFTRERVGQSMDEKKKSLVQRSRKRRGSMHSCREKEAEDSQSEEKH